MHEGAVAQLSRMVDGFNVSEDSLAAANAIVSQWSVAAAAAQFPQVYPPGKVWDYFSPDINLLSYNLRYSAPSWSTSSALFLEYRVFCRRVVH